MNWGAHRAVGTGAWATLALSLGLGLSDADAARKPSLFIDRDTSALSLRQKLDPTVSRSRSVSLSPAVAPRADSPVGTRLRAPLFGDVDIEIQLNKRSDRKDGGFSWRGSVVGDPSSTVRWTSHKGRVAANIRTQRGSFQLRPDGAGAYAVREIDERLFPSCDANHEDDVACGHAGHGDSDAFTPTAAKDAASPQQADTGATTTIDLLIAYTATARSEAGGTAAIEALIQLAIDESNDIFENSTVAPRFRLVHSVEVAYTESGSTSTDLGRLQDDSDGYMDELHTLRDTYGADMVSLLFESAVSCGRAYRMVTPGAYFESYAFSLVNWSCATGYYSLAHELGHNLGAHHALGDGGLTTATATITDYSYGWRFTGDSGEQLRTVMAYSPGTRIPYFSNPDVVHDGIATGIAIGDANEANNAAVIDNQTALAASWRSQVVPGQLQHDVAVFVSADGTSPAEGQSAIITVTVTNLGTSDATSVRVDHAIPAGLSISNTTSDVGTYNSNNSRWTVGALASGAHATLTFSASPDVGSGGQTFEQIFDLHAASDDNSSNDVATVTLGVPVRITIVADPEISVTPGLVIDVAPGGSIQLALQAAAYFSIGDIATNGVSVTIGAEDEGESSTSEATFVWNDVTENGTIEINAAAIETTQGTPLWWLAQYGLTNDADTAAASDYDADGAPTWAEFDAGTDPLDAGSALRMATVRPLAGNDYELSWSSVGGRVYRVEEALPGFSGYTNILSGVLATPPMNVQTVSVAGASCFVRVRLD